MAADGRSGAAVVARLTWGLLAAVVVGAAAAFVTGQPTKRTEAGGEVIHLKGPHGPAWGAVVVVGGVVGAVAGMAGAAWRYTRPG